MVRDEGCVLVVDDDPSSIQLIEIALGDSVTVLTANSGEQALSCLRERDDIALALIDVKMPGMSGFDTVSKMREDVHLNIIPVIFMSATELDADDFDRGFALGCFDYIVKPARPSLLKNQVMANLAQQEKIRDLISSVAEVGGHGKRLHFSRLEDRCRRLEAEIDRLREAEETAYQIGKAEICTSVLHNIGNILNSSYLAANDLCESLSDKRPLRMLGKLQRFVADNVKEEDNKNLLRSFDGVISVLEKRWDVNCEDAHSMVEYMKKIHQVILKLEAYTWGHRVVVSLEPSHIIEEVVETYRRDRSKPAVEISCHFAHESDALGHRSKLVQVLSNLIDNACEAAITSEHPKVSIKTREDGAHVIIEIGDNGTGIAEEEVARIFQLGYTTKPGRAGFGLHYCAIAVQEMGGSIGYAPVADGTGSCFALSLERDREPAHPSRTRVG